MAFLGSSRGLGRAVALHMANTGHLRSALLMARSENNMQSLSAEMGVECELYPVDFSQAQQIPNILDKIAEHNCERVFYFAGGGPHGLFAQKEWKDHLWSLQVSFLTPSEVLHSLLRDDRFSNLKQIVFIGSKIADNQPDPLAASYASAKHGLKGLIETVQAEHPRVDVRFYRPGYMNTELLPKNAKPRVENAPILEPSDVAKSLVEWADNPSAPKILDSSI